MSLKVLLADDEPGIRLMVTTHMARRGWEVQQASDGAEALRLAAAGDHDVIVLDQRMPGRTGLEVARTVEGTVPAVIYSAYLDEELEAEAQALGCRTVDKTEIEQLLEVVAELGPASDE